MDDNDILWDDFHTETGADFIGLLSSIRSIDSMTEIDNLGSSCSAWRLLRRLSLFEALINKHCTVSCFKDHAIDS